MSSKYLLHASDILQQITYSAHSRSYSRTVHRISGTFPASTEQTRGQTASGCRRSRGDSDYAHFCLAATAVSRPRFVQEPGCQGRPGDVQRRQPGWRGRFRSRESVPETAEIRNRRQTFPPHRRTRSIHDAPPRAGAAFRRRSRLATARNAICCFWLEIAISPTARGEECFGVIIVEWGDSHPPFSQFPFARGIPHPDKEKSA